MIAMAKHLTNGILVMMILISLLLTLPLLDLPGRWYQLAIIKSASMEPTLPVGSLALYRPADHYQADDVVAYQLEREEEKELVIHRIKEVITADGAINYLVQGDANTTHLPQIIVASQIEGKLITVIPRVGELISHCQGRVGSALIVISLLLLVLTNLWMYRGE